MDYMTVKDASALWGYSADTIRKWCREGVLFAVVKAEKRNGRWVIPANVACPKSIKHRKEL